MDKEMIATIVEWLSDREGDINKGADVFVRMFFITLEAYALHFSLNKPVIDCAILSSSIFFFVFDYWISYTLIKNGTLEPPLGIVYNFFTYQAKKGYFDNLKLWRATNPWVKFGVRLGVFIAAIIIFIV